MTARTLRSLLWLALGTSLGAAREFVFVNLNYQIDFLAHARDRNYAHSQFRRWADGLSLNEVLVAKWLLAAAFIGAMLVLSIAMARTRFGDARFDKAIVAGFIGVAALALAFHAGSALLPSLRPVSIAALHALQYPVPLLLVWVVSLLKSASER